MGAEGPAPLRFEDGLAARSRRFRLGMSRGTRRLVAIDPEKRPFAFTMRWALMGLAFLLLVAVIVWVVMTAT